MFNDPARLRPVNFRPAGPQALLVEVSDLEEVAALRAEVQHRREAGWAPELVDVVSGARTLLLDGLGDVMGAARAIRSWPIAPVASDEGETIEIECVYDGPDLDEVAAAWGVSPDAAAAHHSSLEHSVAFCGFNPGWAYLAGLDEAHAVARRENPRTRVPAGSVALAGPYTGVYPRESPGGWQLIGRTDAVLWDVGRRPPALLVPGHRVRFVDVT
jgi:KipI family sensor histidine kinase inhibitor